MKKLKTILEADFKKVLDNFSLPNLHQKTILISGATGLIGTYLIGTLQKFMLKNPQIKIKIYGVHYSPITPEFRQIINHSRIVFLRGDLADLSFCQSLPKADIIIHGAGYAQPQLFLQTPEKTYRVNALATSILLNKLKNGGRFLFISSSEVYNGCSHYPYQEEDIGSTTPQDERACYIEGKRGGETVCFSYFQKGVRVKIARLSLIYGPGVKINDKRILYALIQKGLTEKGIALLDKGKAQRTYCYVTDAVIILWKILFFGKEALYNVGGISNVSIAQLAKKIARLLNKRVIFPKSNANYLKSAPNRVKLNIRKVKNEFKIKKFVSLDEGLENTLKWYISLYKYKSN